MEARDIGDCDSCILSSLMLAELFYMTFQEQVKYQKAMQMFKTILGDAPEYLRTSFTVATDIHAIRIRSSYKLHW